MFRYFALLLAFGLTSGASLCRADDTGLVAYYRFDEGKGDLAVDSAPFKNDGKLHGAEWVKLPQGWALQFDGADSYVNCGSPKQLNLRGPLTLMSWVCPAGVQPASEPGIMGKQFSSYLITYYMNRKLYFYINSGGNNVYATVMPEIWTHIAATFDGKMMRLYVNGEPAAQKESQYSVVNEGKNFFIGTLPGDPQATDPNYQHTYGFKGSIDDVKVYDRALSAEEIRSECKASDTNRNEVFKASCTPVIGGEIIRSGSVAVRVGKNGAMQINNGRSFCVLESSFSYPGHQIGANVLGRSNFIGEPRWKPRITEIADTSLMVEASGEHYSLRRKVQIREGRIEFSDTLTNLQEKPVGILVTHHITTPEMMTNARRMTTADNPTIFFSQIGGDFGFVAEDDISRLQFDSSCIANSAKLRHSNFGLEVGKTHTFRYAVYPLRPTGDWFSFINRVRQDWKSNFTVAGPCNWIDVYGSADLLKNPVALKKRLDRQSLKILPLSPWLDYDPGFIDHVISREEYKTVMREAARAIRAVRPDIKVLGCIETDWVTIYPDKIPGGKAIIDGPPAEFTQVIDAANLPWKDSLKRDGNGFLSLERYRRGGKLQFSLAVYPAPGNYQERFLLDQARFLIEEVGLDGFYIDEFSQAWSQSIRSYDVPLSGTIRDGVLVNINPKTGEITERFTNCSLAGVGSRLKLIDFALSRGKNITCNTYATSMEEQSLPAQRFWEMQAFLDIGVLRPGNKPPVVYEMCEGVLASPIGLGVTASPMKPNLTEGLMLGMLSYLRHGLLYYHYWYPDLPESGAGSGEYGPINHMFPLTPVGLHEGWIEGKERTVTCVSGIYTWRHQDKPAVHLFGLDGRERPNAFAAAPSEEGWRVKLNLRDWAEIAVIE